MGLNLDFGVSGYVAVRDMSDRELYRQDIQTQQQAEDWIEQYKTSIQGWGILKSSFVPVRVDNWTDLFKDLFLPTFINHALRINNLVLRVLASIFALPWDLLTLAFRLIALPIRLCYNPNASDAQLSLLVRGLIQESPFFEEAMRNGVVCIAARVTTTQATTTVGNEIPDAVDVEAEAHPFEARQDRYDAICEVCLKTLPWHQENSQSNNSTQFFRRDSSDGLFYWQGSSNNESRHEVHSV